MKNIPILLLLTLNLAFTQNLKVNQAQVDSFDMSPIMPSKLDSLRKILSSNPKLKGWTSYFHYLALYKYKLQELDSVIYYQEKAIDNFNRSEQKRSIDEQRLVESYFYIGQTLIIKKLYNKALFNLQKALEISEKYPYKWKSFILGAIASCHLELGNKRTALKYFKESLNDSILNTLDRPYISANTRIGAIYLDDSVKNDSAKHFFYNALKRSLISNFKGNLTSIHSNLGYLHQKNNEIDSAIFHYKQQKLTFKKYKPTYDYAKQFMLMNNGYVQIHEDNLKKAYADLIAAYDTIKKIDKLGKNERDLYLGVLDNLALYYSKIKDHANALKKTEEKSLVTEKYHSQLLEEKLNDLEFQFQSKQKDASIKQLTKITNDQNTIIKQRNLILVAMSISLILVLFIGYLLFRQKNLQSRYDKVNLEQRLLRSQMSPHFIFNSLNIISGLANKKSEKTKSYILKFSRLLRLILNNSREEFVLISDEILALRDYLSLQSGFGNNFDFAINIDDNIDTKNIYIPPMLIQPFVENSIAHGIIEKDKGKIVVDLKTLSHQKLIECIVKDNGVGIPRENRAKKSLNNLYKSVSTDIVRERLKIYNKKFKVNSILVIENKINEDENQSGAMVKIMIPYLWR